MSTFDTSLVKDLPIGVETTVIEYLV